MVLTRSTPCQYPEWCRGRTTTALRLDPVATALGTDTLHAASVRFNSRWQRHRITYHPNSFRPSKGRIHLRFNSTLSGSMNHYVSDPWALPTAIQFVPCGDMSQCATASERCPRLLNRSLSGCLMAAPQTFLRIQFDIER